MGELSIHRWKGFELYPVINKKTVIVILLLNIVRHRHCCQFIATVGGAVLVMLHKVAKTSCGYLYWFKIWEQNPRVSW